jgi:hypothetical protein
MRFFCHDEILKTTGALFLVHLREVIVSIPVFSIPLPFILALTGSFWDRFLIPGSIRQIQRVKLPGVFWASWPAWVYLPFSAPAGFSAAGGR